MYKETKKDTAIEFTNSIGDYDYKGSYNYDSVGNITKLNGTIYKGNTFLGSFNAQDGGGALGINSIPSTEDFTLHATNVGIVVNDVKSAVKSYIPITKN
jgi:hypothetical protein